MDDHTFMKIYGLLVIGGGVAVLAIKILMIINGLDGA